MVKKRSSGPIKFGAIISALWLSWLLTALILAVTRPASENSFTDTAAVLLHLGIGLVILLALIPRTFGIILSLALLLRTLLVLWDIHMRHVMVLLHSGNDTEGFYRTAISVSEDLTLLHETIYGGAFSKLYGVFFFIVGPARAFAQYTNTLFAITALILIYQILTERLRIETSVTAKVVAIGALLPNSVVLSAIFLRESLIALLLTTAAACFIHWFQGGPRSKLFLAILLALASSAFHSGMIVVALSFLLVAMFYQRSLGRFGLSAATFGYLLIILPALAMAVWKNPDLFLGKFDHLESAGDVFDTFNTARGGSAYLSSMSVDNVFELVVFGPIRALYFVAAPMPWDWRGFNDVAMTLLDSSFYVSALFLSFKNRRALDEHRVLAISLIIIIVAVSFMFGAGVSNAGTAVRHRYKIASLFLIVLALGSSRRQSHKDSP